MTADWLIFFSWLAVCSHDRDYLPFSFSVSCEKQVSGAISLFLSLSVSCQDNLWFPGLMSSRSPLLSVMFHHLYVQLVCKHREGFVLPTSKFLFSYVFLISIFGDLSLLWCTGPLKSTYFSGSSSFILFLLSFLFFFFHFLQFHPLSFWNRPSAPWIAHLYLCSLEKKLLPAEVNVSFINTGLLTRHCAAL